MSLSVLKNPQVLGGLIKVLISALGGGAIFTGDQMAAVAGALAVVVTVVWSAVTHSGSVSKKAAAGAVEAAAKAESGSPDAEALVAAAKAGKF